MKRLLLLNPENATDDEVRSWPTRLAARAVVVDDERKAALLHVRRHGYYKLPGGGVDDGEDVMAALARECLEEIGCHVKIENPIGMIEEYRKLFMLHQISYCYTARVVGPKGQPDFTDSEKDNDFAVAWVPLEEAERLLETCKPNNQEGLNYIIPRDREILSQALKDIKEPREI